MQIFKRTTLRTQARTSCTPCAWVSSHHCYDLGRLKIQDTKLQDKKNNAVEIQNIKLADQIAAQNNFKASKILGIGPLATAPHLLLNLSLYCYIWSMLWHAILCCNNKIYYILYTVFRKITATYVFLHNS